MGDSQRREKHEDVFFGGDEQAVVAAGVADLRGVVFVFDFDADGDGEACAVNGGFANTSLVREANRSSIGVFV